MNSINLAPLWSVLGAFLLACLNVLIPILGAKLMGLVGIKLKDAQWAVVDRTAMKYARQIWAEVDTQIATKSIYVNDPLVVQFANLAITEIPDILKKLGLTPDAAAATMGEYIQAHLGAMQAHAATAPVPLVAVPVRSSPSLPPPPGRE